MTRIFWMGDIPAERRIPFASGVQMADYTDPACSTKTIIGQFRLAGIYDRLTKGDFLFIQFGRNDMDRSDPARCTDPVAEFPDYLERFVNVARNKGAYPVFIASGDEQDEWAVSCCRTAERLQAACITVTGSGDGAQQIADGLYGLGGVYRALLTGKEEQA